MAFTKLGNTPGAPMANVRISIKNNSSFQTQAKGSSGMTGYQMAEPFLCQGLWQIRDLKLSTRVMILSEFLRRDAAGKIGNYWIWTVKAAKSIGRSFAGSPCCSGDGRDAARATARAEHLMQKNKKYEGLVSDLSELLGMLPFSVFSLFFCLFVCFFSTHLVFICIFIYIYKNTYIKKNLTDWNFSGSKVGHLFQCLLIHNYVPLDTEALLLDLKNL